MKKFTARSKEVKEKLRKFEGITEHSTGVDHISGGFAVAEISDYDDEQFDVELKWGIQSDCENVVHTEQYKLSRTTLEMSE
jgi:hypothetical protein